MKFQLSPQGLKVDQKVPGLRVATSPYSLVLASVDTGPSRFPSRSPKSRNLYLWAGSRPETVTSRRSPPMGTAWGCPCASLYCTRKESKGPWATVHERRAVSEVMAATASSPRRGTTRGSVGSGAGIQQRRLRGQWQDSVQRGSAFPRL